MKWFKHHCDLCRDEGVHVFLEEADKNSLTAYGFLVRVLEVICEKMIAKQGDLHCSAEYSKKGWSKVLNCHVNRVEKYMELLPYIPWVFVEFDAGKYRVTIPRMYEWRDDTTKKSGVGLDKSAQSRSDKNRSDERETK